VLRHLEERDAGFILESTNDPDWIQFIGDRGLRTREDAVAYLRSAPIATSGGRYPHRVGQAALADDDFGEGGPGEPQAGG